MRRVSDKVYINNNDLEIQLDLDNFNKWNSGEYKLPDICIQPFKLGSISYLMTGYMYNFIKQHNLNLIHEYDCKDSPLHSYVKNITVPFKVLFTSACCSYINNK